MAASTIGFAVPVNASTATPGPDVAPTAGTKDNPTCSDFSSGTTEIKIDRKLDGGDVGKTFEGVITITKVDGNAFDFTSTQPVQVVVVKGGTLSAYNVYDYTPLGGTLGDDGLTTKKGQEISHVSFCYTPGGTTPPEPPQHNPNGALEVVKTAAGTFDRAHSWTLTKDTSTEALTGNAGGSAEARYTIVADKITRDSNYGVGGTILVRNTSNNTEVTVNVADSLDGAVVDCDAEATGDQNTGIAVAMNSFISCVYTAPGSAATLSNTATATATATVPSGHTAHFGSKSHTASISYSLRNETGAQSGTITDPMLGLTVPVTDDTRLTPTGLLPCSSDPTDYTDGTRTTTVTNTATLTLSEGAPLADTADVSLTCTLAALEVEKTAVGTFDRTASWGLKKTATPTTHTGLAGATFDQNWLVDVTRTDTDANHTVTGTVTITNDAGIPQAFTATDKINGTTDVPLSCPGTTVAPGDFIVCSYSLAIAGASSNTATVTADGNRPVSDTVPVTYTANPKGDQSVLLTDHRFKLPQKIVTGTLREPLDEVLQCPTDSKLYDANGLLTLPVVNTATITGDKTNMSANATSTLNCSLPWVDETATGKGTDWTKNTNWFMFTPVASLASGAKVDLVAGQSYDAGDIALSGNQLTIRLHDGYRFDPDLTDQVKVHPLSSCKADQTYVEPGAYSIKKTATGTSITVTVPTGKTVCAYAIHVDTERLVR